MHGIGNDFVIIDNAEKDFNLSSKQISTLCNRKLGIGCDQLILTEEVEPEKTVKMTIYNADGSLAEACGNATRCVAWQAMRKYQTKAINVKTQNRLLKTFLISSQPERSKQSMGQDQVLVNMGKAVFEPAAIPLRANVLDSTSLCFKDIGLATAGHAVNVGNPHVVFIVDDVSSVNLETLGPKIERHPYFPARTNVEFVQVLSPNQIKVRVWERGTGITSSCGTGAMASFTVAHTLELIKPTEVEVILEGGSLILSKTRDDDINITGPVCFVFEGKINTRVLSCA